jgi:tRNA-Thr(GGU) m(6)t(6)A37 methyltransferase TsaA
VTVIELRILGRVESSLVDPGSASLQGDEGGVDAVLRFDPGLTDALRDLRVGDEVVLLTWLDRARRDVLVVYPRGDSSRPETGVFSTRSPDRPNPIGLHRVQILAVNATAITVAGLEALDNTPILDVKPVLGAPGDR